MNPTPESEMTAEERARKIFRSALWPDDDGLKMIMEHLKAVEAAARAAENEACAKIFDRDNWPTGHGDLMAASISPREVAAAIRARMKGEG
jgi:hypothetical protein